MEDQVKEFVGDDASSCCEAGEQSFSDVLDANNELQNPDIEKSDIQLGDLAYRRQRCAVAVDCATRANGTCLLAAYGMVKPFPSPDDN